MPPLLWPIVILLLGMALIVLEMFIPSGGVLGFLALSASVVAVGLAFYNGGLYAGTGFLAVTGLVVPLFIVLAVRWWPHTSVQPPAKSIRTGALDRISILYLP